MTRPRRSKKRSEVETDPSPVLRIEGRQTIECADTLLAELRQQNERGLTPVLDLEDVSDCSTATLQLLCSAAITAASAGGRLRAQSAGPELMAAIRSMGLHRVSPFECLAEDSPAFDQGASRSNHAS